MSKAEQLVPLMQAAAEAHVRCEETAAACYRAICDESRPAEERQATEIAVNQWLWSFGAGETPTVTVEHAERLLAEIALEITRGQAG